MAEQEATEKVVESPVLEKPVVEPVKPPEIDKDALVTELTKMGVKDPNELVNMQRASREAGNLANLLGTMRNENAELKRMIQQMSQGQSGGYQQDAPAVDLGKVVRNEVEAVVKNMTTQQLHAQEQLEAELADIETDRDFPAVQDIWNKYLGNRLTQTRLRRGETTLTKEYYRLVGTYKDKMLEAQMNALRLAKGGQGAIPHVESGNTQSSPQMPRQAEERERKVKQLREAHQKGNVNSDDMLANLVKTILPADDPMWRVK